MPGCVFTFDALHAVKKTFEQTVIEKQADYLVCIKGNAAGLHRQLEKALDKKGAPVGRARTVDGEHGRIEIREIEVVPISPIKTDWPHTHVACRVTRDTETMRRGEVVKTSHEQVLYVGSFAPTIHTPEKILGLTRGHWSIENCLHHRKDRSMNEDRNRASVRGIGQVMCCLHSITALVLGRAKESMRVLQRRFSKKTHLILGLISCGSLAEWEQRYKPYKLA